VNVIRINQAIINDIRSDLARPHPYAYERVGFLFCRQGLLDNGLLALATSYESVPDNHYIDDPAIGAKISTYAIRNAMQRVMDTGCGAFHVHIHEHHGRPNFSIVDERNLLSLIPSFQKVGVKSVHGAVLLSLDEILGLLWMPGVDRPIYADRITVVGFPTAVFGG
jgi:hypothetical protein